MRVQLDYKVISRASRRENKTVEFQMPMIDNAKFEIIASLGGKIRFDHFKEIVNCTGYLLIKYTFLV